MENSIKAQQSAGYEKWAKLHNLKQAAMTLNFLTEHGIDTYSDLEIKVAEITAASDEAAAALKAAEYRLADIAVLIKNVTTYKQLRPVALEYRKAADKAKFRREHESTLILYEAAAKALREQGVKKLPDLYALKAEYKRLAEEKERLYEQYGEAKKQMHTAASDKLLYALALSAGVVLAVALQKINAAPDAQAAAQSDHDSLQSVHCAVEKFHKWPHFLPRFAAHKIV